MRFRILIVLAALAVLASCTEDDRATNPPPPNNQATIDDTPRENREAEEAALWLSGDLVAPQDLYDTIRDDLDAIRGEYLDSIPLTATEFRAPWLPGLAIQIDDATWDKLRNHEPNPVDSLNTVFHATGMDTLRLGSGLLLTNIQFEGRLHPLRLAEFYSAQPGVIWAEPRGYAGDFDNVYPWDTGSTMTYLFREGYGDCPAGCIYSDLWYFRRVNGTTEYVGSYRLHQEPEPTWWKEAKAAFDRYRTGY